MVEILTVRVARLVFGANLQFIIIPLAILGLGFGGIFTYFTFNRFLREKKFLFVASLLFILILPLPFLVAHFNHFFEIWVIAILFFLTMFSVYLLGGMIISFIFVFKSREAPVLYFFDLLGGAFGSFLVIFSLDLFGNERTILHILLISFFVVIFFALNLGLKKLAFLFSLLLILFAVGFHWNHFYTYFSVRGCLDKPIESKSNSFSQIDVYKGALLKKDFREIEDKVGESIEEFNLRIDCPYSSTPINARYFGDLDFLKSSPSLMDIPFVVRESLNTVLIAGSGGGIDVQRALLFEADKIVATEINPLIIELAKKYSNPQSYAYDFDNVRLVIGDTRRFMEGSDEKFDLIFNIKSGEYGEAGLNLSEGLPQYLRTVEAYRAYLDHLSPQGILVASAKEGMGSTAVASFALREKGLSPNGRIVLIKDTESNEYLQLVKNEEFTPDELLAIEKEATARGFNEIIFFGDKEAVTFLSKKGVPTDNRPYFKIFDKESDYFSLLFTLPKNLLIMLGIAIFTSIVAFLTISFLKTVGISGKTRLALCGYFSALGIGFMLFELTLIHKFHLFLANPTYAMAVTLPAVLLFGGLGSMSSRKLNLENPSSIILKIIVGFVLIVVIYILFLNQIFSELLPLSLEKRIGISITLISLPSFLLGMLFPIGLRIADQVARSLIPMLWGINSIVSILGGVGATVLSIMFGFNATFITAIGFYFLAWISVHLVSEAL